jgi:hypothetical protein
MLTPAPPSAVPVSALRSTAVVAALSQSSATYLLSLLTLGRRPQIPAHAARTSPHSALPHSTSRTLPDSHLLPLPSSSEGVLLLAPHTYLRSVAAAIMDVGAHSAANAAGVLKRKRSVSNDRPTPAPPAPQKTAKTTTPTGSTNAHLAINYLARQYNEDLPLISNDGTLPSILQLLNEYQGVLDRHESMACNLGARPLGPILIKRFERLFDGPPKVLKTTGKELHSVSWLDVVEFARNKPEQFSLGQMSEGLRVCQFYTKQCRVQISEEDYLLISSGMPQKLIPPQPIVEDEEKELGTLEILEKNLSSICHLADQGEFFWLYCAITTVAIRMRQAVYQPRILVESPAQATRNLCCIRSKAIPCNISYHLGHQGSSTSKSVKSSRFYEILCVVASMPMHSRSLLSLAY